MASFQELRITIFERSCAFRLAEPVAWLLAAAFEPRDDVELPSEHFSHEVLRHQRELRNTIEKLRPREGGRAEALALHAARELRAAAEAEGLSGAAAILDSAIQRCREVKSRDPLQPMDSPEIERIPGDSGKPIGLWR